MDLLKGKQFDLSDPSRQSCYLEIAKTKDVVICTPPCSDFSRAKWANKNGPPPLRNKFYPNGFPWLSTFHRNKADLNNSLIMFMWKLAAQIGKDKWQLFLAEHPEDLGRMANQPAFATPASIWQSDEFLKLWQSGWYSGAFRQCDYGAPTPKPTRFLSSDHVFCAFAPNMLASFCNEGFYTGPVKKCDHNHTESLIRQRGDQGPFRTEKAAAYPSDMCKSMAECIFTAFKNKVAVPVLLTDGGLEQTGTTMGLEFAKETSLGTAEDDSEEEYMPRVTLTEAPGSRETSSLAAVKPRYILEEGRDYTKEGWWGTGPPQLTWKGMLKQGRIMVDGGGLCSPGRWTKQLRNTPLEGLTIKDILDRAVKKLVADMDLSLGQYCLSVICGKYQEDPWEGKVQFVVDEVTELLVSHGIRLEEQEDRLGQVINFPLIRAVGEFLKDPDANAMRDYYFGASLGVDEDMPRTTAVWPPRHKWKLPEFNEADQEMFCDNYPSADQFKEALEIDVEEQLSLGWMKRTTLSEALRDYTEVDVASLAVVEDKPGKTRVIHDASNKVQVNHRIKVQDSEMSPTALDVQAAVRNDQWLKPPILALVADVSKAHRRVPIRRKDWGYMACSTSKRPESPELIGSWPILVNTVGTYGVGSMSWHWARIGSLFQRISYYVGGDGLAYVYRFADDYQVLSTGAGGEGVYVPLLRWLLLAKVLGIPLKWSKLRGGITADFIGNQYDWRMLTGGLSESRANWLIRWMDRVTGDKTVAIREMRSVVGRLSFSATLLRFLLPYMGPFFAWVATAPDGAVRAVPVCLLILLGWMRNAIAEHRVVPMKPIIHYVHRQFLADAKAEGDLVVIGGYEVMPGRPLTESRWFSIRLTPKVAPWAFSKKGQAYRVISSLELFASLLCVMVFGLESSTSTSQTAAVLCMKGITDNKSNESLVVKNMTTKFPSYLILLEYTEQLRRKGWVMDLTWVPRDHNETADALTNEDWSKFTESYRINRELDSFNWYVLPKLYEHALTLFGELAKIREEKKLAKGDKVPEAGKKLGLKRKAARLGMPWDED